MKKKQRRFRNEVNAGSMADIAFLLLIFFLVTTTIEMDKGIFIKLPPIEEYPPQPLPDRNVLSVKINAANELLIEGNLSTIQEVKDRAIEFIMNPMKRKDLPQKPQSAVIALQNDRGTSYKTYLHVYNELRAAYNEIWNEKSLQMFGKPYVKLDKERKKRIKNDVPLIISESEPTVFGS